MKEVMKGKFGPLVRVFEDGDRTTIRTKVSNDGKISLWMRTGLVVSTALAALVILNALGAGNIGDEATEETLSVLLLVVIAAPFLIIRLLKKRDWRVTYIVDKGAKTISFRHARTKLLERNSGSISIDADTIAAQSDYNLSIQHGFRGGQTAFFLETAPRKPSRLKSGDQNAAEVRAHVSALNYFIEKARRHVSQKPTAKNTARPSHNPMN